MSSDAATKTRWQDQVYDLLRQHKVTQFAYVPDAGHRILIDRSLADPDVRSIPLTTEEEGVALIAGADLGGARGVLLMQSSGVGNCVNMFSLVKSCGFPLLTLITMRGEWGEFNPWQVAMGKATPAVLEAMGVLLFSAERPDDVAPAIEAAARMAFEGPNAAAVLLRQRLIGAKSFATK